MFFYCVTPSELGDISPERGVGRSPKSIFQNSFRRNDFSFVNIRYYSDRFPVQRLVRVGMRGGGVGWGGVLRIYRRKRKNDGFYRPKLRRSFLPMGIRGKSFCKGIRNKNVSELIEKHCFSSNFLLGRLRRLFQYNLCLMPIGSDQTNMNNTGLSLF